jgi:phosphate transport system substrate-binding protein
MKYSKISLLAATACASGFAGMAQAQVVLPAAQPHGIGASSITTVWVQAQNCVGGYNNAGNNNGTSSAVVEPTIATVPPLDCAAQELQSAFDGQYAATGSGAGRAGWRTYTDQLATGKNPFDLTNTDPKWDHYQYVFTDSPISLSDQTAFRTASAANSLGAPIQIPLFVLPVAVAYDAIYGRNTATNVDYKYNVKSTFVTKDAGGNATGGLRLNKSDYCKIFNGEITNWNDAALKIRNGNLSLQDPADSRGAAGWASEGAPIRLVGRGDGSGTTDIFSRHLAAACVGQVTGVLKYDKNAQALPFQSGTIDMTLVLPGSPYKTFSATGFANNTNDAAHQSISGAYFDKTTQTIITSQGNEAAGLFMLADGSSGVRDAIKFAPDRTSTVDANVKLNGRAGYIGSDFVKPADNAVLFSAALQSGNSLTSFKGPTPTNATAAFGTVLPPQTIATSGAYNRTDTRTVKNPSTNQLETTDRANPFHWTAVLYANPAATLANPTAGYAITGTTQILPYQCYASSDMRKAMNNIISLVVGKAGKQEIPYNVNVMINAAATAPGVLQRNGIAPLPAGWRTAITETFLKKSTTASSGFTLGQIGTTFNQSIEPVSGLPYNRYETTTGTGGNGLWIQNVIPATTAAANATTSNAGCTPGAGS